MESAERGRRCASGTAVRGRCSAAGWLGSLCGGLALLAAVWAIAALNPAPAARRARAARRSSSAAIGDVVRILGHNALVLALHAMACVAGFIAGSSLPLQARAPHRPDAASSTNAAAGSRSLFVVAATTFSLSAQAYVLGTSVAHVAFALHTSPGLLLLGLLPHAVPELTALFLPLAAWIIASRRGEWDELLAATLVTVVIAVPVLVAQRAVGGVRRAPLLRALIGYLSGPLS